jgi:hypothetical protein
MGGNRQKLQAWSISTVPAFLEGIEKSGSAIAAGFRTKEMLKKLGKPGGAVRAARCSMFRF